MPDEPTPEAIDFIWSQADSRLEAQLRQADALDTKAGVLVGVHALAAGLVASIVSSLSQAGRWVAIAVLAGLTLSGGAALQAFRTHEFDRGPSPQTLWRFSGWARTEIRHRFLSTRFRVLERNADRLLSKARWIARSLAILAVIALMVVISVIVELVH